MNPTNSHASSFAAPKIDLSSEEDVYADYRFVKWLSRHRKLQGIPPSAFFSEEHKSIGENYIRFCFIKVSGMSIHTSGFTAVGQSLSARRQSEEGGGDLESVAERAGFKIIIAGLIIMELLLKT